MVELEYFQFFYDFNQVKNHSPNHLPKNHTLSHKDAKFLIINDF